jgi:hypothetical protein
MKSSFQKKNLEFRNGLLPVQQIEIDYADRFIEQNL